MSKDFEQAYRELAQSEAPDLWDRIEAGIDASVNSKAYVKNDIAENIATNSAEDITANIDSNITAKSMSTSLTAEADNSGSTRKEKETSKKPGGNAGMDRSRQTDKNAEGFKSEKIRFFIKRYSGVAAAILCVAIILPAAVSLKRAGRSSYSGGAVTEEINMEMAEAAMDTAADEASAEGAMQEAAEEAAPEEAESPTDSGAETGTGAVTEAAATTEEETAAVDDLAEAAAADDMDETATKETYSAETASTADSLDGGGALSTDRSDQTVKQSSMKDSQEELADNKKTENMSSAATGLYEIQEGTVLEDVVAQVISPREDTTDTVMGDGAGHGGNRVESETADKSGEGIPGSKYTIVVREDPSGKLPAETQIEVFVPAHASFLLEKDKSFQLELLYTDEKYFTVQKSERLEK